jgi:phasin family protein
MFPFPNAVNPAVRTHIDAQTAFLNDISKSIFRSFQQMIDLNIQLTQTLLEESTLASKQVLSVDRQSDLLSAAASRAQPTGDKLRAYQQHITRLAADAQAEIARVAEQHVQNTTRTARALADEVTRDANEQTERGMRAQQESMRQFADPFARGGDGAAQPRGESDSGDGRGRQTMPPGQGQGQSQSSSQDWRGPMQH